MRMTSTGLVTPAGEGDPPSSSSDTRRAATAAGSRGATERSALRDRHQMMAKATGPRTMFGTQRAQTAGKRWPLANDSNTVIRP